LLIGSGAAADVKTEAIKQRMKALFTGVPQDR
jgi:hypothetical protein